MKEELGANGALVLIPRRDEFEEKSEERVRMLLVCMRHTLDPQ